MQHGEVKQLKIEAQHPEQNLEFKYRYNRDVKRWEAKISASYDKATSPIQAEAQAMKLAEHLQLQGVVFLTNKVTQAVEPCQ